MRSTLLLGLAGLASAHFQLNYPPANLPDGDDGEATGPCGGASVDVSSSSTKLNVNSFELAVRQGHPTGNFAIYASTSTTAPYNFVKIMPNITSSGIGTFCATELFVPSSYAGKPGVLQVINNSGDGQLYLCAAVNFVSSGGDTASTSTCANSTSTKMTWVSTADSNSTSSNSTSSSTTSSAGTSSVASTSASAVSAVTTSTRSGAAPAMTLGAGIVAGVGMVAAGLLV